MKRTRRPTPIHILLDLALILILVIFFFRFVPRVDASITRVQGHVRGTANSGSTIVATFASPPTTANTIVLLMSLITSASVLSIVETAVTFERSPVVSNNGSGWIDGIWIGAVTGSGGTSLTVTLSTNLANYEGCVIDACEYAGTLTLDKIATDWGSSETHGHTGVTATTVNPEELWIGLIAGSSSVSPAQSSPTEGFTLLDGAGFARKTSYYMSLGYLEKIVDYVENANSTVTFSVSTNWRGCIVTFTQNSPTLITLYFNSGVSILRVNGTSIANGTTYLLPPNTTKILEVLLVANYAFTNWSYNGLQNSSNPFGLLMSQNYTIWCLIDPYSAGGGELDVTFLGIAFLCLAIGIIFAVAYSKW